MLDVARGVDKKSVFVQGNVADMSSIEDGAFDVVTTVYTLRNFPDMESGLSEMVRARARPPPGTLEPRARSVRQPGDGAEADRRLGAPLNERAPPITHAIQIRVLRPGGTLLILDAFPPSLAIMKWVLGLWLVRGARRGSRRPASGIAGARRPGRTRDASTDGDPPPRARARPHRRP